MAILDPRVASKATILKHKIKEDHAVDIEFGYSEYKHDAIFIIRAEFDYRLHAVRDDYFEGDGLIIKFKEDTDLRPVYIMISHKTLLYLL